MPRIETVHARTTAAYADDQVHQDRLGACGRSLIAAAGLAFGGERGISIERTFENGGLIPDDVKRAVWQRDGGQKQFAENVPMHLRLIDGRALTKLMVRYNVGVRVSETFDLKQIHEEAFEE